MKTIDIQCPDRFKEAWLFAKETSQLDNLKEQIRCLIRIANNFKSSCVLRHDFAPHSFAFYIVKDGAVSFNGGVIYHGPHDGCGDGGGPTYSVSIDKAQGWKIHS